MTEARISTRISDEMEKELERLMKEEHMEKSAVVRKLLYLGAKRHRLGMALADLREGRVSLSKAAEDAGLSIWELIDEAARYDVAWVAEDTGRDLADHPHRR